MEDVLHRCREKLSPLAEEYYSDLLESTSPPVSVAMPGSSEASSSSLHSSVVSRQTSVQGKSPVVHDSVCQTSPRSSIETTVSQPITHVTSPHKVDYCRVIVQAYRVRRSTSRYGLSHRDQSRRDVWMGVITPHFRDRCITPSWMTALGHFLSTPSPSSLPERPV